jgi:hypothetical protein
MSLHFGDASGEAFPSLATLGASCGMSKATAAAMVDLLEADGHIEIIARGHTGARAFGDLRQGDEADP